MSSSRKRQRISEESIRRLFNDGRYWERAMQGEFKMITRDSSPAPKETHQRPGAKSEIIEYYSSEDKIAVVFQYTNPDGSLGASGKPDPKALLVGDTLYIADKSIKN
jgi:hypothetical protein